MRSLQLNRLACVALMLTAGLATTAGAQTLTVGPGQTFATIQAAVNAANGGDTVLIYPGTYEENVVVSNYDSNGDYDYDDPGDKDYSNLVIAGVDRATTIIKGQSSSWVTDGLPFNVVTLYDPRGVNTSGYRPKASLLFQGQRIGDGSATAAFAATTPWPNIAFLTDAPQYVKSANYIGQHGGQPIEGILVRDLTFDYTNYGLFLNGYYEGATIRDCTFKNCSYGLRLQGGVSQSLVQNNLFLNNQYGVTLYDDTFDNDIVNNTILIDDNVVTDNPTFPDGNWLIGVLLYNSNNNQGEFEAARNQVTRNNIDFRAFTGVKPTQGMEVDGGRDLIVDNNNVQGTNQVASSGVAGWLTANKGLRIEGWTMADNFQGVSLGVHTDHEVSRMKFTDFADFGTVPPTVVAGSPSYHHLPCDPNFGRQLVRRTFTVPATGNTTLTFKTWFSDNGWQFVRLVEEGGPATQDLFQNHMDFGTPDGIPNRHFGPPGAGPTRHAYGASCSGDYVTPDTTLTAPNRVLNYSAVPGVTRSGDELIATATFGPEWAGKTVTLEFDHYGYYLPAFSCDINGSTDWCGWYVKDVLVSNSNSGTVLDEGGVPIDETDGVDTDSWERLTYEDSYALSFSNSASAADNALYGPFNSGFEINQNEFSNPWGNGLVFNSNLSTTDPTNVTNNSFYDNSGYALVNRQANPVNAEDNWWNSNSGPTIASNPTGDGEAIFDPAGVVDYDPWTRGLVAGQVTAATFGVGTTSGCNVHGQMTINFFDGATSTLLGSLGCNGTFTPGAVTAGGPLLIQVTAVNPNAVLAFKEGDHINVTTPEGTFRAYLPANRNGLYGTSLYLWADSDGSTFFACDSDNRNCLTTSGDYRSITVARNSGDFAQRKGFLVHPLITTAGSDFNWFGMTHFTSEVANARQLYNTLNTQFGGTLIRTLSSWNATSQTYTQYVRVPFESGNFNLRLGLAYRAEVNSPHNFVLAGAEPARNSLSYNLVKTQSTGQNWISIPWYKTDLVFASDVADDIDTTVGGAQVVSTVNVYNPVAQTITQYINDPILGSAGDFDVNRGQAVRIDVLRSATWNATLVP